MDESAFAAWETARLRRRLLAWFDRARRDLPWRRTRDPYRIWVSEVMLQQTQVATVIPFYERFLQAFPDIHALAAAAERRVLKLWEGLGYYRRARDLHHGAKIVAAEHAGRVPNDPAAFARLPGIGRYTANAVLSQAFGRRLPILEANSMRVLCRLTGCTQDPRAEVVKNQLWRTAELLLPRRRVGDFNQALMELGALVCTPRQPRCAACPLASLCVAHARGFQADIPRRAPRIGVTRVEEVAVVIRKNSRVLLVQRPPTGLWAGLWEFPHGEVSKGETQAQAARRLARGLTGLRVHIGDRLAVVRHGVTRFRITMTCFDALWEGGRFGSSFHPRGKWVNLAQLKEYPLSTPQRKLAGIVASA